MKKSLSILSAALLAAASVIPSAVSAADDEVYGTMQIPYADFYAAELNNSVAVDAVSSATANKWNMTDTGSVQEDGTQAFDKGYPGEAMQQIPETSGEDINSYEIFAESNTRRYVNSEGVDVTVSYPSSTVEVVVNARNDKHEIELYRMYTSGTCDKENLVKEISKTLNSSLSLTTVSRQKGPHIPPKSS